MFASDAYQLLDFGASRKLERFGPYVIDRPEQAAGFAKPRSAELWLEADARFDRDAGPRGQWTFNRQIAAAWPIQFGPMTLGLRFTESGQVGLFPEQAPNWDWVANQAIAAGGPIKVLNLFGYTGGSTLATAAVGAEVTHVDAAANVVAWARRNVAASGMEAAPIRWITEDAITFMRRELKRGNSYEAVVLDPPAYGHGPKGQRWKLSEQLGEILELCLDLTAHDRRFLLLTCHSGELVVAERLLKAAITSAPAIRDYGRIEGSDLYLASTAGRRMHCGAAVRWCATSDDRGSSEPPTSAEERRAADDP
jgi:23S rRNA (cytosine1962-C5)-methyltransferase